MTAVPVPEPGWGPEPGPEMEARNGWAWFDSARPFCNPVEVDLPLRREPPPASFEGRASGATCLALAGEIRRARGMLDELGAR